MVIMETGKDCSHKLIKKILSAKEITFVSVNKDWIDDHQPCLSVSVKFNKDKYNTKFEAWWTDVRIWYQAEVGSQYKELLDRLKECVKECTHYETLNDTCCDKRELHCVNCGFEVPE